MAENYDSDPTHGVWSLAEAQCRKHMEFLTRNLDSALWRKGMVLAGVNIKYRASGVLLVVTVSRSAEGPQVAFFGGKDVFHAMKKLVAAVTAGSVNWKIDEYQLRRHLTESD